MTCVPRNTVQLLQCTSICYGRRGEVKKTGMHRYHPPPRIHECFPIFPCKDMWYFSQPHSERNNNNYFFTVLCAFFGFLPSPKPGSFWWLWYHFFTICRGIYWAEECLFYFGPFDSQKKENQTYMQKNQKKKKMSRCRGSNQRPQIHRGSHETWATRETTLYLETDW